VGDLPRLTRPDRQARVAALSAPRVLFRVLARGDRWHVWREGSDRVEFVGLDWHEMKQYVDERRAIEGEADMIVQGFGTLPDGVQPLDDTTGPGTAAS